MSQPVRKSRILDAAHRYVSSKKDELNAELVALHEAQRSDTKSSAGDKHETGREMIAQEINKVQRALGQLTTYESDLQRIDPSTQLDSAMFGAFVKTEHGNYFLSTSLGRIDVDGSEVHCISMVSPLAKSLLGAHANDSRSVNGITHKIQQLF